ncbi:MAG: LemA family protein [Propionibacteriaceae bacterium]|jgi:LemA protein|nr:LemA family protein [Propionibacteriaceae bacterium]
MVYILITLAVIAVVAFFIIGQYNGLVALRNRLQESWRQVDVELNRRYDLLPNLVEIAKGYAFNERETLERITALRTRAQQVSQAPGGALSPERAQLEQQLTQAVTQFFAVSEAYPDLKSNTNFLQLQAEVVETENRIANSRKYYNAIVGDYNTRTETFPSGIISNMFGFQKAGYFEVNDPAVRSRVNIDMSDLGGRARQEAIAEAQPPAGALPPAVNNNAMPIPAAESPVFQPAPLQNPNQQR